jgi:phosphoribosyl 1,2-cyclic phosphodiesterase
VTSRQGEILIIDAGTGIHALGNRLVARRTGAPLRLSLLLTHFHLDHVQGLPFFAPLYSPRNEVVFYAATEPEETRRRLGRLMGSPFFPVSFEQTPAKKIFKKIGSGPFQDKGIRISACPLNHPQGSIAYRLEEKSASIVFATDTEHPPVGVDGWLAEFARRASCLVYDAMFTPEEYAFGKKGWGHSTWREGMETARAAGVRKLILSHFNPEHSDERLHLTERLVRRAFPASACAREGMRVRFK